ncbi:MAG: ice-binding family protein, partial [Burkholderiales bacterium]
TVYTAIITTAATDLAGNALGGNPALLPAASNYVWTFTTAAAVIPAAHVSVLSTNPAANAATVCPSAAVNATFSVPAGLRMDPTTISTATFTVTGPAPALTAVTAASVVLDAATGSIATFTPQAALTIGTTYTATIKSGANGVKDLAIPADTMTNDFTWNFTVASCAVPPPPPVSHLGSASTFGIMATSAITNTGAATIINGDVALSPGSSDGLLPAQVNGTIHLNDAVAHQADIDLLAGYSYYKGLPPGTTITGGADLGALYPLGMPPGTYTSGSTMLVSTTLILDARGDANAVWVFQIGSSLTTNTPLGSISLINGAQAKNVFWVPSASATIGVGTTFYGTVLAGVSATGQTGAIINGRLLAGAVGPGTVALDTNTINVPAP